MWEVTEKIKWVFNSILNSLGNMFTFKGRSSRKDYWTFFAFAFFVKNIETLSLYTGHGVNWMYMVFVVVLYFSMLALGVRRMHDIGKSGIWYLFPFVNFYLATRKSEFGSNKHGDNPNGDM